MTFIKTLYPPEQMVIFGKLKNITWISMYDTPFERCWGVNSIELFNKEEENYSFKRNEFKRQNEKD